MAFVAMENRLFRIHPNARDTPFMEACAAFLTPKMSLSQVMPSGCHFRRVAQPPSNLLAVADRPSASDYQEEQLTITPDEMRAAVTTPVSSHTVVKPVEPGWPKNTVSPWILPLL